ncbi:helix-turn-helix domain-containing protein [Faecalibacterium prausnitzii]|nr:helix-turn-helix domain-containing protein [Faecalibacterium prausnitzii]
MMRRRRKMMARPLPQWCKNVKIELVRRDMSISDLAKLVGLTKQYTSGIVSGRNYSETAVKNISDALNIPDSPYQ